MADWKDFLFGKGALQKAAGNEQAAPQPSTPAGIDIGAMAQQQAQGAPMYSYGTPHGMSEQGNIDLKKLLPAEMPGGRWGTVHSGSSGNIIPGKEVLYPLLVNGVDLTPRQAEEHARSTGRNLGTFDNPEDATNYALKLHSDWERGAIPGLSNRNTKIVGAPYPSSQYAPIPKAGSLAESAKKQGKEKR